MSNFVLLLVVVFLAAAGAVSVKIGIQSFSPYFFIFLRYLFAFLLMLPLLKTHSLFNLKKSKKLYFASFFAVLNVVLFVFGLKLSTIINSSIISPTTPLMIGVISHLFLNARYKRNEIFGALLGFFGALYVVFLPVLHGEQAIKGALLGNLLFVGASLSFALYNIFSRSLHDKFTEKEIATNFFLLTWTTQLIFTAMTLIKGEQLLVAPLTSITLGALIFAVFDAVAFYILFQRLIARAGSVYASFIAYLNPVASIALAVILLGEKPTLDHFIGASMTLFGVWLYGRKK